MATKYTLQQLAEMLKPNQLGLSKQFRLFLLKVENDEEPIVKALLQLSNWRKTKNLDNLLQATPTFENYYILKEFMNFEETDSVWRWRESQGMDIDPYIGWERFGPGPLKSYQIEGAGFLSGHHRAMLSLSPGLGKTLTSAYAAGLLHFQNILVVCPASLLFYWKGELEKWAEKLPCKPRIKIWHKKLGEVPDDLDENEQFWAITNPETVTKQKDSLILNPFDCLIVDESIMYKHRDSQRSQAMKLLSQSFDTVWLLTGAPATRYLDDMWHQFHILKPKAYPSYWRFARTYCVVEDGDWGSKVLANRKDAEKQIRQNYGDIYFSRTQDDVEDIPPWIFEDIDIQMPEAQSKAYDELRAELRVELATVDPGTYLTVSNHLSLMVRSVQVASNPLLVGGVNAAGKWDALPELMQVYPGPWLVWVNFIKSGELIRAMLNSYKYRTALANGSTSMEERNQTVDAFQKGDLDVLILNNQVGKFGFTLTKARTAFFVERMYDDSYFQCLHRNRRIGTTQSPIVVNMRSVTQSGGKTLDHLIHDTLDYRVGMIKAVTAGDILKYLEPEVKSK